VTQNIFSSDLPVAEIVPQLRSGLRNHNTLILTAPPGAGKSTLIPLTLLNEPWLEGKKILMLEPRRLAAKAVASRMAELLEEEPGQTIGYRVRFDSRVSAQTRIEVLTEGILTRMLQSDNTLDGVGLVIFDEFHERSIHADLSMALCREAQQVLRQDLRILVMSATLDTDLFAQALDAPVISSSGKEFPVQIQYGRDADDRLLPELAARQVMECLREEKGDILVFLPGEAEIRKCASLLEHEYQNTIIFPLYGQLPPAQQKLALLPDKKGRRKVVLATSIAETSLTIVGVRVVIDSGYTRKLQYDPGTGLSRLITVRITEDAATQRAGRAGRTEPGVCYRMWTNATQQRLDLRRTPEILDADLCPLVLELAAWGIRQAQDLTWINEPPKATFEQSRQLLEELEALQNGQITVHGRDMLKLGCHPRLAHMLLKADSEDSKILACDVAAILEERDPLGREAGSDINLRIEKIRKIRSNKQGGDGRFTRIIQIAESYRKSLGLPENNGIFDSTDTGLLLVYAYPERIASARPGNNAQFQLSNGRLAMLGHQDSLAHEPWLAVAHLDMRDGMGKIFLASPINPTDLSHLVHEKEILTWDTRKGGLLASKDLRLGNLVLRSKPLHEPDPGTVRMVLFAALEREGAQLLNWDEETVRMQNRIGSLRLWNPAENWPDASTAALLKNLNDWFTQPIEQFKRPEDLKRIKLASMIEQWLGWERLQELNKKAPTKIPVPSGSMISLAYGFSGEPPVLSVRLQEVFGMADTPRVNEGKNPVLMHLLSPGYKPVQVTSDLNSFWNATYYEVRKELKRRYPKHAWPDDPWTAIPIAKGQRPHK
jgi:ATP-dependent helicase HrpB